MSNIGVFPFGQPVLPVAQRDRSPKRVFVLGVYASAVHARWVGRDDKVRIAALGVASEPEIFWRGTDVEAIISRISVPHDVGHLEPASKTLNGPSDIALDERHPRQAARLGAHSAAWSELHEQWTRQTAPGLLQQRG